MVEIYKKEEKMNITLGKDMLRDIALAEEVMYPNKTKQQNVSNNVLNSSFSNGIVSGDDIYNMQRQGLLSKLAEKIGLRETNKKVGQQSKIEGIGDIIDGVRHLNNATKAHDKAYQEFLEKNASSKDKHDELWNKLEYYEKIKGPNGAVRKGVDEVNEGAKDTHLGILKTLFGL